MDKQTDKQTDKLTNKQTNMTDYPIVAEGAYNKSWYKAISNVNPIFYNPLSIILHESTESVLI